MYDVAVVGGGPAGLMAAIFAAKTGAKVVLLEKNDKLGRKILATGNGRCNISNSKVTKERYHGSVTKLFSKVYEEFDNTETRDFFESLGVLLKEEDRGRLFPVTNQAQTVVTALEQELQRTGVEIRKATLVRGISQAKDAWEIELADEDTVVAKQIILTTGGKAAHQLGSSGDGLFWAKKLGIEVSDISVALVAIESEDEGAKALSGLKMDVVIKAYSDGELIVQTKGDMIFTHFGVSGPAAMSVSGILFQSVSDSKYLEIDFMPDMDQQKVDHLIRSLIEVNPKKTLRNILAGFLPDRLADFLMGKTGIDPALKGSELSKDSRTKIIGNIKSFHLDVTKARPLKEAQVTRGGVIAGELTPVLESKNLMGLYFAGEIVDIDGDSGGFNLQWAWSSGAVTGMATGERCRK